MSAFTNLISNMVSGFIPSVISMFTGLDNKGWTPDRGAQHVAEDLASLQDQDLISNYMRKTTGSSLTNAEMQANEWNRQQTLDAWERTMSADNTKYQRQVADMQAAGLNPMLAAGGSVSSPVASVASGVSPSAAAFNIGDIAKLLGLKSSIRLAEAQAKDLESGAHLKDVQASNVETGTELLRSQIEGSNLDNYQKSILNSFIERQQIAELNLKESSSSYFNAQVSQISKQIEKMDFEEASILVSICETKEKINLLVSQQNLNRAQIEELASLVRKYDNESKLIDLNIQNFEDITVVGSNSANVSVGPFKGGESHPVTLKMVKDAAERRKQQLDSSSSYKSDKRKSLFDEYNGISIYD